MKILIIGGISTSLINFRGHMIKAFIDQGHQVIACSGEPDRKSIELLNEWSVDYFPLDLSRAGTNPLNDIRTFVQIRKVIKKTDPDMIFSYTIKPVIWGSLAAASLKVKKIYSLVTGLGFVFEKQNSIKGNIASNIAKLLYRISLRNCTKVIFQNPDNKQYFIDKGIVKENRCDIVNGSGVDTNWFNNLSPQKNIKGSKFLLMGRLLKAKGIGEYIDAIKIVKKWQQRSGFNNTDIEFAIAGDLDPNPTSISQNSLQSWIEQGLIKYLGHLDDPRTAYNNCNVYVLPSYSEGTPRTVLEAMSMECAIITTNVPGCRETIKHNKSDIAKHLDEIIEGENGYLVPVKNARSIAEAMIMLINDPDKIRKMGISGREFAKLKYDVHKVNEKIINIAGLIRQ